MISSPPFPTLSSSPPSFPPSSPSPLSAPLLVYLPSTSPQTPTPLPRHSIPKRKTMTRFSTPTLDKTGKSTSTPESGIRLRPVLTLHTFLISAAGTHSHSKFVHATNSLTLTEFIEKFRSKHKINASLHLTDIELTLDDMVLGINLDDGDRDWDWEALMAHFGKTEGLVKVTVRAS